MKKQKKKKDIAKNLSTGNTPASEDTNPQGSGERVVEYRAFAGDQKNELLGNQIGAAADEDLNTSPQSDVPGDDAIIITKMFARGKNTDSKDAGLP